MERLLDDDRGSHPASCPHGRSSYRRGARCDARKLIPRDRRVRGRHRRRRWPAGLADAECVRASARLLTSRNSNGFIPGEAAAAVLVGRLPASRNCCVVGDRVRAREPRHIDSELAAARRWNCRSDSAARSRDAACGMHDLDFGIDRLVGRAVLLQGSVACARTRHCASRRKHSICGIRPNASAKPARHRTSRCCAWPRPRAARATLPAERILLHTSNDDGSARCSHRAVRVSHGRMKSMQT